MTSPVGAVVRESVRRIAWAGLLYLLAAALLSACDDEPTTTPTAMPTPTHTATPTRLSQAAFERSPMIVEVTAEPDSNAVLVRLSKTVYVRGDIWLDTSGGPTANADGGGSRMLMFKAGDLTGSVEVQGVSYGLGAALRDIHGSDAVISLQPIRWTIGDKPVTWDTGTDPSSPSEVEGITVDGGYWRVTFTKPVYVVGDVQLSTSHGTQELVDRPGRSSASRFLRFANAPSGGSYSDSTTVSGFYFDDTRESIMGMDGRDAALEFEPVRWTGFPKPPIQTMADCVYDAYFYANSDSGIDLIRADTIAKTDSSELTDAQRFAWYEFFDSGNRYKLQRSCIALWSEEITPENAGKRNEQYGITARGNTGCVDWVKSRAWESDPEHGAAWNVVVGLLEKPYLSLTAAEKFVLRSYLEGHSNCRRYYPQLFSGRWIPLQDE